jgi:hypothetical protein
MNTFKNAIGWRIMVACVLAGGCTLESGVPEGEGAEGVAGVPERLAPNQFSGWSLVPNDGLLFAYGAAVISRYASVLDVLSVNEANSHMMLMDWANNYGWYDDWFDLGGEFNSKPAATAWIDKGALYFSHYVFVGRGKNDNRYWYRARVGANLLSDWAVIPTGTFDSAPATAFVSGKVVVCGRAGPQIWCATNTVANGNLTSWTPWVKAAPGSVLFDADPGLASDPSHGTLRLMGRDRSTGHYWYSSSTDGVDWQNFTEIPDAFFYSGPAVSGRQSAFEYFGEGGGHLVWETSTTESNVFQPLLGRQIIGSPTAAARDNNHVHVIGLDSSKLLWINTWEQ